MTVVADAASHPLRRPWAGALNTLGLTDLDVATGMVLGTAGDEEPVASHDHPLKVLEAIARDLLTRARCVVAFSGGRDSSALLAVLLEVARREGLPEPIAVTARWPGDAASDEREWQERVAAELRLRQWEIVTPGTDLDLLGPSSCRLLRSHGLLWPAAFAALLPMIDVAGDGVLVSGEGGDEVFAHWPLARPWTLLRRRFFAWSPLKAVAFAALPESLRRRRSFARASPYQEWLRPDAQLVQRHVLAAEMAAPLLWPDHLRRVASERGLRMSGKTFSALCATRGGSFARPLLAPAFLAALALLGGPTGMGERTACMLSVFGSVLGPEILSRHTKASFGEVFWGPAARQFARDWDGEGLDPHWVDTAALRAAWRAPTPVYGSALALQAAWLARERPSGGIPSPPPGGGIPLHKARTPSYDA